MLQPLLSHADRTHPERQTLKKSEQEEVRLELLIVSLLLSEARTKKLKHGAVTRSQGRSVD